MRVSVSAVYIRFAQFSVALILLVQCTSEQFDAQEAFDPAVDSMRAIADRGRIMADSMALLFPRIDYSRGVIHSFEQLAEIRRTYAKQKRTMTAYRAFTTVNRKDIQFFRVGDTVMIPDSCHEDLRAYSVFPMYYPAGRDIPKIIFISNKWQSYACYEHGILVRFAAANTGEERKPTLPGRYAVNWKQRLRLSSLDSTWILPFTINFHQYAGSALHQFEMPGRPVSHSCVRQFIEDAEWLYLWVKTASIDSEKKMIPYTGTPLIIVDYFDYSRRRGGAWWDVGSNKAAVVALPDKPMEVEEALIPMSQVPKDVRGALPNRSRYIAADSILRSTGVIRDNVRLSESIDYNKLRREKKARQEVERRKRAELETGGGGPADVLIEDEK